LRPGNARNGAKRPVRAGAAHQRGGLLANARTTGTTKPLPAPAFEC